MWPFETSKAITAAILVLNHYPTVDTLDGQKFWRLLWQYTATHTPAWRVMDGVGNNGRKGTGTAADDSTTASLPPVRSQDAAPVSQVSTRTFPLQSRPRGGWSPARVWASTGLLRTDAPTPASRLTLE